MTHAYTILLTENGHRVTEWHFNSRKAASVRFLTLITEDRLDMRKLGIDETAPDLLAEAEGPDGYARLRMFAPDPFGHRQSCSLSGEPLGYECPECAALCAGPSASEAS